MRERLGRKPILLVPDLPSGYRQGTDILKVFATREVTSYRWLELPALDQPPSPRPVQRSPANMLEQDEPIRPVAGGLW